MCLLFDKVICHFAVEGSMCGGGLGVSQDFSDAPLVKAGIIELREELLVSEVFDEVEFTEDGWGTQDEFDQFYDLQVTAMALRSCQAERNVPVTDDPEYPVPASLVTRLNLRRLARMQAAALGIQSLQITLPSIGPVSDSDILEARERLAEQIVPFRRAMLRLAPNVRQGLDSNASLEDIQGEARYIAETAVEPLLAELRERISKEEGRFWRRLLLTGAAAIPRFALNWVTRGALAAALDGLQDTKDLAHAIVDREALARQGGIGYLLQIADDPLFDHKR